VNIIRDGWHRAEAGRAERVGAGVGTPGGTLGRRGVLGGLAALPVLYGVGAAAPASADATAASAATAATVARQTSVSQVVGDLVRGPERRYNAPLLTAGTRLVLPTGVGALAVEDYYHHPHAASAGTAWPNVTASDGSTVDASVVPDRGAPTRIAVLSGFTEGWYELRHASGRTDRVTWDARKLPALWIYGEFGATNEAPYRGRFYTLALQPLSRNPYSRNPSSGNPYSRSTVAE
jgi:hypothetical protein